MLYRSRTAARIAALVRVAGEILGVISRHLSRLGRIIRSLILAIILVPLALEPRLARLFNKILEENMTEVIEVIVPNTNVPEPPDPTLAVAPEVAPVVEAPQLRYCFQPTDEHGRRVGGEQVILYRTPDELAEKLRDQNVLLIRKLREVNTKNRLGISDDKAPEGAERMPEPARIEKKNLTPEERYAISQKIADPATFEEGRDQLLESAGWSAMQQNIEQQRLEVRQLKARTNAQMFIEQTPDFYLCADNLQTLTDWMVKNELEPSVRNFEIANSTLQEAGLLLAAPIVREEARQAVSASNTVPNVEPAAPVTRISDAPPPQQPSQPARVPSGLNSRVASNTGIAPNGSTLTLAILEGMHSDEYKRRLQTDPKFAEQANKIYAEAEAKSRRPR